MSGMEHKNNNNKTHANKGITQENNEDEEHDKSKLGKKEEAKEWRFTCGTIRQEAMEVGHYLRRLLKSSHMGKQRAPL